MTKAHIIYIPFSGVGIEVNRGEEWLRERIKIFEEYTLKSLVFQKEKNFYLWMSFRPEDFNTTAITQLERTILESGIQAFFTFDGLMYYDDKFEPGIVPTMKNVLRLLRRSLRNHHFTGLFHSIWQLRHNKNSTLKKRLAKSLSQIKLPKADYIYLTRLDSDDMLHYLAVERIQEIEPKIRRAIVMKTGYIYDTNTGKIAEYHPDTNPPFHTITFPRSVFFNPRLHEEYYGPFKSHEDITKVFNPTILGSGYYCVVIHNKENHISTLWNHPFRKEEITNPQDVLKVFLPYASR